MFSDYYCLGYGVADGDMKIAMVLKFSQRTNLYLWGALTTALINIEFAALGLAAGEKLCKCQQRVTQCLVDFRQLVRLQAPRDLKSVELHPTHQSQSAAEL